jgi:hypothetical protein
MPLGGGKVAMWLNKKIGLITDLNNSLKSENQLDDIPGRIIKDIQLCFTGLKKKKPIYEILNL